MQVHAVPDSERAFDSTGRKLPWAYEFADSDKNPRRVPEEKGPFGKARKRGTSRAKTPTANSAANEARESNFKAIDLIFSQYGEDKSRSLRGAPGQVAGLPPSASAPNLIDAGSLSTSFAGGASTGITTAKVPTEVILYGYGADAQWAAISHYEKVSNGLIYEDYDREPYNPRVGATFTSFGSNRASTYATLHKSALRKVNEYVGGDHWIKVTFNSAEAAERACHYSPHSIQGYTVFAEAYRGVAPTGGDRSIRASVGGAMSQTASPNTLSSGTVGARDASQSSTTMSSATATASIPASTSFLPRSKTEPLFRGSGAFPQDLELTDRVTASHTLSQPQPMSQPASQVQTSLSSTLSTGLSPRDPRAKLRLKGANVKPAVFLPPDKAFLPAPPRWQQTVGSVPIIGWVIGSGQGIIGNQMPRKEDGSFDAQRASVYWRVWYTIDACFGTDFCGVKELEYDD